MKRSLRESRWWRELPNLPNGELVCCVVVGGGAIQFCFVARSLAHLDDMATFPRQKSVVKNGGDVSSPVCSRCVLRFYRSFWLSGHTCRSRERKTVSCFAMWRKCVNGISVLAILRLRNNAPCDLESVLVGPFREMRVFVQMPALDWPGVLLQVSRNFGVRGGERLVNCRQLMSTDEGRIKGLEIDGYLATLQNSSMSRLQAINWSLYHWGARLHE